MIGVKSCGPFQGDDSPVLYLPAIGLLISLFSMTTNRLWVDESSGLYLGKFVSSMLWALMNHLGFCSALAGQRSGETRKAEAPSWRP